MNHVGRFERVACVITVEVGDSFFLLHTRSYKRRAEDGIPILHTETSSQHLPPTAQTPRESKIDCDKALKVCGCEGCCCLMSRGMLPSVPTDADTQGFLFAFTL